MSENNEPVVENVASEAPAVEEETLESLKADRDKWKSFSRKHEDAAKLNSAAASRLKEIEDAAKTAEEKLIEELAQAKETAKSSSEKLLKHEVAAAKNVPAHLLVGSTKEELEAAADALLEFRGEAAPAQPVANLRQGNQGTSTEGDVNANLRAWSRR